MSDDSLAVGTYTARAVKGSEQYTADKGGNLMLGLDMQVEGGDAEGSQMTLTMSFSGKAAEYSIKKLRMLGWTGTDVTDLAGIDANAVPVRVYEEEYDGKTRRKIEIVYGGGSFKFKDQADERMKKQFAASLKGLAASIPPQGDHAPTQNATGPIKF